MNWLFKMLTYSCNNWGYSTQPQARFNCGDFTRISQFIPHNHPFLKVGDIVVIEETARCDYIVVDNRGNTCCIYQHELEWEARNRMDSPSSKLIMT